ncbi:PPOX class F420-dependent enzyme [Catellatospora methionotrophica]|uniref:PPOX class F420-dependent enzyme n=1 Tax=Catellatospora methionotrophica TaxID=121620 RepID=A0A8J3LCB1_9ACTN|nr:PPOX class F420-dependent oxidoreductase [Catellatospora methionotrophica]GIG18293.1 PPOX class F420-dependent enzyme [Catellatospora methionotrophica]
MSEQDRLWQVIGRTGRGVLATVKRDGRPQLSNVDYLAADGVISFSSTATRAKIRNLRRDPRASFHVTTPGGATYAVAEGLATLSATAADPHDAAVDELVALYRDIRGEHPDWPEYRAAMVTDARLTVRIHVDHLYGWLA